MSNNLKFEINPPSDCTSYEKKLFYDLTVACDMVQKDKLEEMIENCLLLGFCYHNKELVGISALKRPRDSYKDRVINNANLARKPDELNFEIGYSCTKPQFRRKGISSTIKEMLCNKFMTIGGTLFSTTANPSSARFLKDHGFQQLGLPYDGKHEKGLRYYELRVSNS